MNPIIFGEVLFDYFEDGNRVLGGAPFNVAWHLAAFDQHPQMISSIGNDDDGAAIRQCMAAWGMDDGGVQTAMHHATGRVQIQLRDGEPHYDIVKPVAWDVIDTKKLTTLRPASVLYHGTLAVRSDTSRDALQHVKHQSNTPLFVDVNLRDPWWQRDHVLTLIGDAHWVKLNHNELATLFTSTSESDAVEKVFLAENLQFVLLTKGAAGAILFHRDGRQWQIQPSKNIPIVDTVGAGDAFTSIFLLGVLKKWPEQQTLQRAQDFASAVIGLRGATTDDKQFYQRYRAAWGF